MPRNADRRRCEAVTRDGRPCPNWARRAGTLCSAHDAGDEAEYGAPRNGTETVICRQGRGRKGSYTALCHVLEPEVMLHEAVRVLRPGGCVVVYESDDATSTVAKRAGDSLEACVKAFHTHFVHAPWLVRRLPPHLHEGAMHLENVRSYGYVEVPEAGFMLSSWIELVANALIAGGRCGACRPN